MTSTKSSAAAAAAAEEVVEAFLVVVAVWYSYCCLSPSHCSAMVEMVVSLLVVGGKIDEDDAVTD
jgi:hypothetical protein